jgi:parallel beta-helix repeat protein
MEKRGKTILLLIILTFSLLFVTPNIVLAQRIWSEVARFTGSGHGVFTTEIFTCNHADWRMRYEYIPGQEFANFSYRVFSPNSEEYLAGFYSNATETTNGISTYHNTSGSFYLQIISFAKNYTIIIEQDSLSQSYVTIFIKADGTVEGTDKIQRDKDIYMFTDDIFDEIVVKRSNIILDGKGYSLHGSWKEIGINLTNLRNVTIKNTNIHNFATAILIQDSINCNISGNTISRNQNGIILRESSNNILENNDIYNGHNFAVYGSELSHFINDIDTTNTINSGNKKFYYLTNQENLVINPSNFPDVGYLALVNCKNITVQNLLLVSNGQGVLLAFTTDSKIVKNYMESNRIGIELVSSSNNYIIENNITNTGSAIYFDSQSSNNTIYHNTFVNYNTIDPLVKFHIEPGSVNVWDNGAEGNYWTWNNNNFTDNDGDGIGDEPYVIDENNQDNHPLLLDILLPHLPEFPSSFILVFILVAGLTIILTKKVWRHIP